LTSRMAPEDKHQHSYRKQQEGPRECGVEVDTPQP
jgi:hypothetical protein